MKLFNFSLFGKKKGEESIDDLAPLDKDDIGSSSFGDVPREKDFSDSFGRTQQQPLPPYGEQIPAPFANNPIGQQPQQHPHTEMALLENVKARIDLMTTQMESMRIQYESMSQRIAQIDAMVRELVEMART